MSNYYKIITILPYFVTVCSMIGTIANSFKKRWCFYVWGFTNTFWLIYNFNHNQYAQALLYLFNLITTFIGLIQWKKSSKEK